MRQTKLPEVNMGQWFKLCTQLNKSSSQIRGSSAQLRDSEFGPAIKLFIFSPEHSSSSVECAKKTKKLNSTEVILNFNNALHWHRREYQSYLETMAWSPAGAREFTGYKMHTCVFHWAHPLFSYTAALACPVLPCTAFNLTNLSEATASYLPKAGNAPAGKSAGYSLHITPLKLTHIYCFHLKPNLIELYVTFTCSLTQFAHST